MYISWPLYWPHFPQVSSQNETELGVSWKHQYHLVTGKCNLQWPSSLGTRSFCSYKISSLLMNLVILQSSHEWKDWASHTQHKFHGELGTSNLVMYTVYYLSEVFSPNS